MAANWSKRCDHTIDSPTRRKERLHGRSQKSCYERVVGCHSHGATGVLTSDRRWRWVDEKIPTQQAIGDSYRKCGRSWRLPYHDWLSRKIEILSDWRQLRHFRTQVLEPHHQGVPKPKWYQMYLHGQYRKWVSLQSHRWPNDLCSQLFRLDKPSLVGHRWPKSIRDCRQCEDVDLSL